MRNRNNGMSPSAQLPPKPACQACGKPIDLQRDNVLMELVDNPLSHNIQPLVWHQRCYDRFLDEGEEC
jgi:hypothetical protein